MQSYEPTESAVCDGGKGTLGCCTESAPCAIGEGKCKEDMECKDDLICGLDNCRDFNPDAPSLADCCIEPESIQTSSTTEAVAATTEAASGNAATTEAVAATTEAASGNTATTKAVAATTEAASGNAATTEAASGNAATTEDIEAAIETTTSTTTTTSIPEVKCDKNYFDEANQPVITFQRLTTDAPEESYPGVVYDYKLNIKFQEEPIDECSRDVSIDVSSISPINVGCYMVEVDFEVEEYLETYINYTGNYMDSWCADICFQNTTCKAFVVDHVNNTCYEIHQNSTITEQKKVKRRSGYKDCTVEETHDVTSASGLDGPSSIHIFDISYPKGTNISEVKYKKPLQYNIIDHVTTKILAQNEVEMKFSAIIAKSFDLMADSYHQYSKPTMMITSGVQIRNDLIWIGIEKIKTKNSDSNNYGLGISLPDITVESSFPNVWEVSTNVSKLLEIKVKAIMPWCDFEFDLKSSGVQDAYYFGKPVVTFHGLYAKMNSPELLAIAKKIPSGNLDRSGWRVTYPNMYCQNKCLNVGCNTEDFNDEDFIEIQVPVTFLGFRNNEIAMSEEEKSFEYELIMHRIRKKSIKHYVKEIVQSKEDGSVPSIVKATPKGGPVSAPGDVAVFAISIPCPDQGLVRLNTHLSCPSDQELFPVNIAINEDDNELFGYIPPSPVVGLSNISIQVDFGNIHNFKVDNILELYVVIHIGTEVEQGSLTCTFGVDSVEEIEIEISVFGEAPSPKNMTISYNSVEPHSSPLYGGEEVAYDFSMNAQEGHVYSDVSLMATELSLSKKSYMRICSMEMVHFGKDLVCPRQHYQKFEGHRNSFENSIGSFFLPRLCTKPTLGSSLSADQIVVRAVFENKPGIRIDSELIATNISFNLIASNKTQYVSQIEEKLNSSTIENVKFKRHDCLSGKWYNLVSGRSMCLKGRIYSESNADQYCKGVGGYLGDIKPQEWFDVQYFLYKLKRNGLQDLPIKTSGSVTLDENGEPILTWKNNGNRFRIGKNETLHSNELGPMLTGEEVFIKLLNFDRDLYEVDGVRGTFQVHKYNPETYIYFICMRDVMEELANSAYGLFLMKTYHDNNDIKYLERGSIGLAKVRAKFRPKFQTPLNISVSIDKDERGPHICRLKLLHVGTNMPCVRSTTNGIITDYNSTKYTYSSNQTNAFASISFDKITNWGEGSTNTDSTRDHDTLEIGIFIDTSLSHLPSFNYSISTQWMNEANLPKDDTKHYTYNIGDNYAQEWNLDTNFEMEVKPMDGSFYVTNNSCKRIIIEFKTQSSLNVWPSIENLGFDSHHYVMWCGFFMLKAGENFPCYNGTTSGPMKPCVEELPKSCYKTDDYGTKLFWRTTFMRHTQLQYYKHINDINEDLVQFELSVRVPDTVPEGTVIPFKFSLCTNDATKYYAPPSSCTNSIKDINFELTVDSMKKDISTNITTGQLGMHEVLGQPSLSCLAKNYSILSLREKEWIHFEINFPFETTLPFLLSVNTESDKNRTWLHIKDIQFSENNNEGRFANILGMNDFIDIRSNYNTTFFQSENVTTFNQMDSLLVDFGYVTSPGVQRNWFGYRNTDGVVGFKVEIEMSDHPDAEDGTSTLVQVKSTIGDVVQTCSTEIMVRRNATVADRKSHERPIIQVDMEIVNYTIPDKFSSNSTLPVRSLIYHSNASLGEGYPATVRFLMDDYMAIDEASISINYTKGVAWSLIDPDKGLGSMQFKFENGIMFPDVISLNFSLHLDYRDRRQSAEDQTASIITTTNCYFNRFEEYPNTSTSVCAKYQRKDFIIKGSACNDEIVIQHPKCQIQSNFALSNSTEFAAYNILNETLFWAAPIRTGPKWEVFVQIDFQSITRVTKIKVGFPFGARGPTKIRVDHSVNSDAVIKGSIANLGRNKYLLLKENIIARTIRLVVVETNDVTANLKPISINNVKFHGCLLKKKEKENSAVGLDLKLATRKKWCARSIQITSDDPKQYRHFVVDTDHGNLIYLCDRGEYKDGVSCLTTTNQGQTWRGLPLYIHSVLGYSGEKGRVYMTDRTGKSMFSTFDGLRLESTAWDEGLVTSLPGWRAAIVVPGEAVNKLNSEWANSPVTADFYGIQYGGRNILNWQSCCLP